MITSQEVTHYSFEKPESKQSILALKEIFNKRSEELLKSNRLLRRKIIELNRAEANLRQSEKMYRHLFENTGMATAIIEKDKTISKINEVLAKTTGYTKEEIEGKTKWPEFVSKEDYPKIMAAWEKIVNSSETRRMIIELTVKQKNGDMLDLIGRWVSLTDKQQIVMSFIDVSKLKRTQAALAESERKLSSLLNHLPGMIYSCSDYKNMTFSFLSEGCVGITGLEAKKLTGANGPQYRDLIHPEDLKRVMYEMEKAILAKLPFQISYRIHASGHRQKWVIHTGQAIFSKAGDISSIEGIIIDATERVSAEEMLKAENLRLKSSIKDSYRFGNIIGKSNLMQKVYEMIIKASGSDAHVTVYGESGTGKELVARAIHENSARRNNPFVAVNCGAIPENLFESEFFGYKKGAFTGATQDKKGYFDYADGGTLFLDEIGEISLAMQVKLLRAIEDGGYLPVGSTTTKKTNVRIIAATNRNLKELVHIKKMRDDFYYRIHIVPIYLPPLRKRMEDLPLLIEHFLKSLDKKETLSVSAGILDILQNYDWPGNVRELQNVLNRYVALGSLNFIKKEINKMNPGKEKTSKDLCKCHRHDDNYLDLHDPPGGEPCDLRSILSETEKQIILKQLNQNKWNKSKTASALGIDRKTLLKKIKSYGLVHKKVPVK